jgi:polygalacturonase
MGAMRWASFLLLAAVSGANAAEFPATRYGATGDGKTVDTAAIQRAIDDAAPHHGTVVFKAGVYLSGSLFLKSGVHFRVDQGVEIHGVQDQAAYPVMPTRVAGIEMKWPAALINVYEQTGVEISGRGVIDGDGKMWWDKYWKMRREDYEPRGLRWAVDYDCQRPRLIQICKSSGVDLSGLTLKRSGFWTVHICYSNGVKVDGLIIRNNQGGLGPSTDGIDIDSSTGVLVQHCDIDCNDDAFCLKAGRDADGLRVNRPSQGIVIRDNVVRGGAAGITFGSETSGGIHDVEVYRMHVLSGVPIGILFKSASTRGGTVSNIRIHDMDMQGVGTVFNINFNWNPSYSYAKIPEGIEDFPNYWRVLTEPVPPERGLPHLRDIEISRIKAAGARQAFAVASYQDSPLTNVDFRDVDIEATSAGNIQYADGWSFRGLRLKIGDGSKVAVKDSHRVTGLPP